MMPVGLKNLYSTNLVVNALSAQSVLQKTASKKEKTSIFKNHLVFFKMLSVRDELVMPSLIL